MTLDAANAAVLRQWHDELTHHLVTATSMPERMAAIERAIELLEAPRLGMAIAPLCVRLGCAVIRGEEAPDEQP